MSPAAASMRVLIVEDDRVFAFALRMLLEGAGFEVRVAGRVEEALRVAHEWTPMAATIDLMLPPARDLEGLEILLRFRAAGIRTLVLTNRIEPDVHAIAAEAADEVLQKSVGGPRILESLRRLSGCQP